MFKLGYPGEDHLVNTGDRSGQGKEDGECGERPDPCAHARAVDDCPAALTHLFDFAGPYTNVVQVRQAC